MGNLDMSQLKSLENIARSSVVVTVKQYAFLENIFTQSQGVQ